MAVTENNDRELYSDRPRLTFAKPQYRLKPRYDEGYDLQELTMKKSRTTAFSSEETWETIGLVADEEDGRKALKNLTRPILALDYPFAKE